MTDSTSPADKKPGKSAKTEPETPSDKAAKPAAVASAKATAPKTATPKTVAKVATKAKSAAKKAASKRSTAGATKEKTNDGPSDKAVDPKAAPKKDAPKPDQTDVVKAPASVTAGMSTQIAPIAIAAILGAVLAIVIQFLFGLAPGDSAARAQIADLQSQIERTALVAGDPEAVGRLQVRLDGMEEDLRALNAGVARSGDVTALEASLNDARERLAVVEASGGRSSRSGRASNSDVAALENSIATLSAGTQDQLSQVNVRISALEGDLLSRLDTLVATQDFAALAARVVTLEDDQLAQEMYKAATALGLAQLARTAQGSDPFAVELEALAALRPRDGFIGQLRPLAQTGVATNAMLIAEFPPVARRVISANRNSTDQGWFARIWARITQLISFRRTGDIEGDTVDAVLARAELRLAEGNLNAAATEMASLPEGARAPAADWLEQAQGRVALNGLIAGLSNEVIGELDQ